MNLHKKEEDHIKSIDALKTQATDGHNIEGGGLVNDPDILDPENDGTDPSIVSGSTSDNPSGGSDPTGTYVHTSAG